MDGRPIFFVSFRGDNARSAPANSVKLYLDPALLRDRHQTIIVLAVAVTALTALLWYILNPGLTPSEGAGLDESILPTESPWLTAV